MSYQSEVLADSPVLYLRLGETSGTTAQDETSNNLDGTYANTPTLGVPGAISGDTAVTLLASSTELISIPDNALLDFGDVFSIECWFKRGDTGSERYLFYKGAGAPAVRLNASNAVELRKHDTATVTTSTATVADTTTWHHLVVVKNGTHSAPTPTKLYLDGVDVTGTVTNDTMTNTTNQVQWGRASSDSTGFNGSLDEVAIYATALSSARVQAHYEAAFPPGYPGEVLKDQPVGYWRLGESSGTTAQDETSNNLDGTYVNTPTLGVTGAVSGNTAVTFNGTDEYITVADNNLLDVGDTFTLEAWVKTTSGLQYIVTKGSTASSGYGLSIGSSGNVQLIVAATGVATSGSTVVNDGNWHHVVVVKNGSARVVYIDGVSHTTLFSNATALNNAANLEIGRRDNASAYFNGSIDEVAVYPTVLSATRIAAHYSAGAPSSGSSFRVFNIGAGVDDQTILRQQSVYPPTATPTRNTSTGDVNLHRTLSGSTYNVWNGLLKWDTSALPEDAVITSAKLLLYPLYANSVNSLSLTAGWYSWDGSSSTDQSNTPETSAITGVALSSIAANTTNEFPLQNPSANVAKGGATYLRLHISQRASDAAPTGENRLSFVASESTTNPGPRLIVEYTSTTEQSANGGAQVAVIPVAGPTEDGYANGTYTSSYSNFVYSNHTMTGDFLRVRRDSFGGNYSATVGLLKWDTSLIPDSATITAASLRFGFSVNSSPDARNLVADYGSWSGVASDWAHDAPSSPIMSTSISSLASPATVNLTSVAGISKTLPTYMRLYVSGGQPTGTNELRVYTYEHATNSAPELLVYYTTGSAPIANFSYTANGLVFSFTDTSVDPDGTIASWAWDFGDSTTSTSQNPTKTFSTSGSYDVELTVTDNTGATATSTQTVVANALPTANYSVSGTGLSRTFTDTSTDPNGTIASWAWDFGDGTTSTTQSPSKTWASGGTYSVTLTVTDNQGGQDSEQRSITVALPGAGKAYLSKHIFKRETTLDDDVTNSQDTIPIEECAYWPSEDVGMIDQEKISWTSKSAINGPGNLLGVSRGLYSTAAVSHDSGAIVGLLGRHDGGISTKRMIPLLPVNASLTLQELRTHEGERFAWVDLNNFKEQAQLDITGAPTASGNVSVTLEENGVAVTRSSVVSGAAETISLVINNAQTAAGDITVTLNGVAKVIPLGGATQEQVQMIFNGSNASGAADAFDIHYTNSTGVSATNTFSQAVGSDASQYATTVRAASYSGWTTSGSGSTVIWTRTTAEAVSNVGVFAHAVYYGRLSMTSLPTVSTLVQGSAALTAAQVADQIRATSFPGWTTGGTGTTVTFTFQTPGNLTGTHQYNPGTTGASSTSGMAVTNGSETTTDGVATAIRTTYAANTYWTVGGTGSRVTWVANSTGPRADGTFDPQATGTQGTMQTVEQGFTTVDAFLEDSFGDQQRWRVLANIDTDTEFNIETSVSGAGTDKAIVSVWGSFDADPKVLLWRATSVNLTEHQLGQIAYGVTEESSTGLTWDVHTDDVEVFGLGGSETYYRDHNVLGQLLRQVRGYFRNEPEQPMQDVFAQAHRQPVSPGDQITIGAWLWWEGIPDTLAAQPLYISLHHTDGTQTGLGSLTETGLGGGQTGTEDWTYVYGTFTIPVEENPDKQAYEFRITSRDISKGTIWFQELAYSIGEEAKRTYLYSPEGVFRVTYDTSTPREAPYARFGRKRIALENQYEAPDGTSVSMEYQSAQDTDSFDATWYEDTDDVLDLPAYRAQGTLEGDGLVTPEILPGFPRLANRLLIGSSSDQPILLKSDGTEFPGGVWFVKYENWHFDEEPTVAKLTSGRSRKQGMHPPVGFIPELALGAVRPETIEYLQWKWHTDLFVAEVYDKSLTISLLAKPVFKRKVPPHRDSRGWQRGQWETDSISAEIVEIRDLAT